ncbi:MAG: molecular chaperone HtpG, partial [Butyricicoccus sp.]
EKFWKEFGLQLKYGAYQDYGMHKDKLIDLFLYHSSTENKLVTLDEYVSRMKEDQKNIYYACGETIAKIDALPQMELLREKGYEVLCLTDSIDDFCMKMLNTYKDKPFKSISDGDLDLGTEEEKEEIKRLSEENKALLDSLKEALDGKVSEVTLTGRLKSHPCCLSSKGMVSLEMEKLMNKQPGGQELHAERVLELNASHPIFAKLKNADPEQLKKLAEVLYTQALLIEGMPVEDPVAYANAVCDLIV